jgi:hypothetical protein
MPQMLRMILVSVMTLAWLGCGGGGSSGGGLDCAWLGGANCWKTTADEATACLPPTSAKGVLAADHKSCTYTTGETVTFTPAVELPPPDDATWNFTISKGGAECLHYENSKGNLKLVVMGHTVTQTSSGLGLSITCPDGTTQSNGNFISLLDCNADAGVSFGGVPGHFISSTEVSLSVALIGTSANTLPLFDCEQPL